jgi:hypothetical protein
VDALKLDLVGPWPGHAFASELLPENPTRWYLTGYLVPESAPVEHRSDADAKDEIDAGGEGGGMDDGGTPDKAAPPSLLPSSMGLSVLVPAGVSKLQVEVTWGDYHFEDPIRQEEEPADDGLGVEEEIKPESYEIPESSAAALQEEPPPHESNALPAAEGYGQPPLPEDVGVGYFREKGKARKREKPWIYRRLDGVYDDILARPCKLKTEWEKIAGEAALGRLVRLAERKKIQLALKLATPILAELLPLSAPRLTGSRPLRFTTSPFVVPSSEMDGSQPWAQLLDAFVLVTPPQGGKAPCATRPRCRSGNLGGASRTHAQDCSGTLSSVIQEGLLHCI